jgi:hypothetical protein
LLGCDASLLDREAGSVTGGVDVLEAGDPAVLIHGDEAGGVGA